MLASQQTYTYYRYYLHLSYGKIKVQIEEFFFWCHRINNCRLSSESHVFILHNTKTFKIKREEKERRRVRDREEPTYRVCRVRPEWEELVLDEQHCYREPYQPQFPLEWGALDGSPGWGCWTEESGTGLDLDHHWGAKVEALAKDRQKDY